MYNFNYVLGEGLQVKIDKDELKELMEEDAFDTSEYLRRKHEDDDCLSDRQQSHKDAGLKESDFC